MADGVSDSTIHEFVAGDGYRWRYRRYAAHGQPRADVVFIHASKDKWITDQVVAEFETNMKSAGKTLTVHRYDADHAFANPSSPRYHEQSAKDSRAVVKAYLQSK